MKKVSDQRGVGLGRRRGALGAERAVRRARRAQHRAAPAAPAQAQPARPAPQPATARPAATTAVSTAAVPSPADAVKYQAWVKQYCVGCHNTAQPAPANDPVNLETASSGRPAAACRDLGTRAPQARACAPCRRRACRIRPKRSTSASPAGWPDRSIARGRARALRAATSSIA